MNIDQISAVMAQKGIKVTFMGPEQIALTDKRPGLKARYWFERNRLTVGVLFCDPSIYGSNILSMSNYNGYTHQWEVLAMFPSIATATRILCEQFNLDPREKVVLHA